MHMLQLSIESPLDIMIRGLAHEVLRDIRQDFPNGWPNGVVRNYTEVAVLKQLAHEAHIRGGSFINLATQSDPRWQALENSYSDFFLESFPQEEPFTQDPEGWANIFANWTSYLIEQVRAEIRESL